MMQSLIQRFVRIVHPLRCLYWFIFRPETRGVRIIISDKKDRVIVIRHTYDDLWYLPGGGVKSDECPKVAALRELQEELGIEIEPDKLEDFGQYKSQDEYKRDTIFVFSCEVETLKENFAARTDWLEIQEVRLLEQKEMEDLPLSTATKNRLWEFWAKKPKSSQWCPKNNQPEVYEANESDKVLIKNYLELVRSVAPTEIFIKTPAKSLADILAAESASSQFATGDFWGIDQKFLKQCLYFLDSELKKYSPGLETFDLDRFYVCSVLESTNLESADGGDIGGFHADISLGYQYFHDIAYVGLLNPNIFKNSKLRVYELMRSFVHDTIHRSTFRTFRRALKIPKNTVEAKHALPTIYRYQYGFNFRNKNGVAYSSASATSLGPQKINLNLLMDGMTIIRAAEIVRNMINHFGLEDLLPVEQAMLREILLEDLAPALLPEKVTKFNRDVVLPTQSFIDYWGRNEDDLRKTGCNKIFNLLFDAMISGDLRLIKKYFTEKTDVFNFWEQNFCQGAFEVDVLA